MSLYKPLRARILRWRMALGRAVGDHATSFGRTIQDPILPLLLIGVIAVALVASFMLHASSDIVLGVLLVGSLTAFLEIKMRNDKRD